MRRIVEPEILDELAPDDPDAVRSRADLRFINRMMGGERWIVRELASFPDVTTVVELGAGEGILASRIKAAYPELDVIAMDIQPRPSGVDPEVVWEQGDVLESQRRFGREAVVVANMFVHHFDDDALGRLANTFSNVGGWLCHEPCRSSAALFWGRLLLPFVGKVTRHDMLVSIRAGFVPAELADVIGKGGVCEDQVRAFGSLRSKVVNT